MDFQLTRTRGEGCVSDLRMDRWLAGELVAADASAIETHVAGCEHCRARLREIEQARGVFDAQARDDARVLHGCAPSGKRPLALAVSSALSIATLAAGLWFALLPTRDSAPVLRLKGARGFGFYVQRDGAVFRGSPGQRLLPGDSLRFVARTAEPVHLAVLSLDGAQRASVYYPEGERAAELAQGPEQALTSSVRLDAVLGPERLYALFCRDPIALEPVRAALERELEAFAAPPGCALQNVLVYKVAAP